MSFREQYDKCNWDFERLDLITEISNVEDLMYIITPMWEADATKVVTKWWKRISLDMIQNLPLLMRVVEKCPKTILLVFSGQELSQSTYITLCNLDQKVAPNLLDQLTNKVNILPLLISSIMSDKMIKRVAIKLSFDIKTIEKLLETRRKNLLDKIGDRFDLTNCKKAYIVGKILHVWKDGVVTKYQI